MAEENSIHNDADTFSHDDMTVMRTLLQTVKGLSPISVAPELETIPTDNNSTDEEFQFE